MALPAFDTLWAGPNRSPASPRMSRAFRSALTVAVLAWAGTAAGQTCEPQHFSGSITVADGSTPPSLSVELC